MNGLSFKYLHAAAGCLLSRPAGILANLLDNRFKNHPLSVPAVVMKFAKAANCSIPIKIKIQN
jgi:hypothetical protein